MFVYRLFFSLRNIFFSFLLKLMFCWRHLLYVTMGPSEGWFLPFLGNLLTGDTALFGSRLKRRFLAHCVSQCADVPFQRSQMTTTAPLWCIKTSVICRSPTETLWLSWSFIFKGTQPLSRYTVFLYSCCILVHAYTLRYAYYRSVSVFSNKHLSALVLHGKNRKIIIISL